MEEQTLESTIERASQPRMPILDRIPAVPANTSVAKPGPQREPVSRLGRAPAQPQTRGKRLLELPASERRVSWNGVAVPLTASERKILRVLVEGAGETVTYRAIYDRVHWKGFAAGRGEHGYRGVVRVAIGRIRGKFRAIDESFAEIENSWSLGYRWRAQAGAKPAIAPARPISPLGHAKPAELRIGSPSTIIRSEDLARDSRDITVPHGTPVARAASR